MARSKKASTVRTTAVIHSIGVGCHSDSISFTAFSMDAGDNPLMTQLIKKESDVILRIDLEKPDKNFPRIEAKVKLKGFTIKKTCDSPKIANLQFSSDQIQQIANYVRSEQEIVLSLTQLQGELFTEPEKAGKKSMQQAVAETE